MATAEISQLLSTLGGTDQGRKFLTSMLENPRPVVATDGSGRKTVQPVKSPLPETQASTLLNSTLSQKMADLTVGKVPTGGTASPVLDWNTFEDRLLKPTYSTGTFNAKNTADYAKQLGINIGGNGGASIYGLDTTFIDSPNNPGSEGMDYTRLLETAKKNGLDVGKYTSTTTKDFGEGTTNEVKNIDYNKLNQDLVKKLAFEKVQNKDTIYTVNSDRINPDGSMEGGGKNTTTYYKRVGDKLVPVAREDKTEKSMTSALLHEGIPFILSSMAGAVAAPLGAAMGVSPVAAGALVKGGSALLSGQNPTGALISSLIPGVNVGNQFVNMLLNSMIKSKVTGAVNSTVKKG